MMIDSANVRHVRREIIQALSHFPSGGWGIEDMPCHPDLLQETSIRIFEIQIRNTIAAACEGGGAAMFHAEQGRFVAALVEPIDQIEEVRFRAAKRIIVLVAIQDAHGRPPSGKYVTESDRQNWKS